MCLRLCLAAAVTALDFSQRNPHILGVGTHDGTIAVYDVRLRQPTPLMASTADTGKHADPVWKVRTQQPSHGVGCLAFLLHQQQCVAWEALLLQQAVACRGVKPAACKFAAGSVQNLSTLSPVSCDRRYSLNCLTSSVHTTSKINVAGCSYCCDTRFKFEMTAGALAGPWP